MNWRKDPNRIETRRVFNSLSEFAAAAARRPGLQPEHGSSTALDGHEDDPAFYDNMTYMEALKIAQAGGYWPEGLKDMQEAERTISAAPAAQRLRSTYQQVGGRPSVPRFLVGHPRNMVRRQPQPDPARKVVRMGIQIARCWKLRPEHFVNQGAATLAAIRQMEADGIQVELWALWRASSPSKHQGPVYSQEILVKPASAFITPADIAFIFCHAAMCRRLCWGVCELESADVFQRSITIGYGVATEVTYKDFDYHLPYAVSGTPYRSPQVAKETVDEFFRRQDQERNRRAA